jgi:hypothetical protein
MPRARDRCADLLTKDWKKFTELYEIDKHNVAYLAFTYWLTSTEGAMQFLDTFGHYPLISEGAALMTFRRTTDIAITDQSVQSLPINLYPFFFNLHAYSRIRSSPTTG